MSPLQHDQGHGCSFFLNLQGKTRAQTQMIHLKDISGNVTSGPAQKIRMAVDFYTDLESECECKSCVDETLDTLVHLNQSYCIPECSEDLGSLSIEQEKAFDRVDLHYLLKTWRAFGFGDNFVSWVKLLYTGVSGGLR